MWVIAVTLVASLLSMLGVLTSEARSVTESERFCVSDFGDEAGGPLLDRKGEVIRGTRMILGRSYPKTSSQTLDLRRWQQLKELGFNTVRVAWVDPYFASQPERPAESFWTVDQLMATGYLDKAVENAQKSGMNLIINYHNAGEYGLGHGFGSMADFWRQVAPRYADKDFVFYELNNEQAFSAGPYLTPGFEGAMRSIYDQVRRDAPDRQVIVFSFSMYLQMKRIVDDYDWIDWKNTSVGYHYYGRRSVSGTASELRNLRELLCSKYRTIATEWSYSPDAGGREAGHVKQTFGHELSAQSLEMLGQSWVDWRGWSESTLDNERRLLIPDAFAKGYNWPGLGNRSSGPSRSGPAGPDVGSGSGTSGGSWTPPPGGPGCDTQNETVSSVSRESDGGTRRDYVSRITTVCGARSGPVLP
jgi:hypothetical protein